MKDSNLRRFRDGFTVHWLQGCDQRKRLARNNFRTYSPQTAVATGANRTLPGACPLPLVVAIEGRVRRLSPVYPPTDAYSLRVRNMPSVEVRRGQITARQVQSDAMSSV